MTYATQDKNRTALYKGFADTKTGLEVLASGASFEQCKNAILTWCKRKRFQITRETYDKKSGRFFIYTNAKRFFIYDTKRKLLLSD